MARRGLKLKVIGQGQEAVGLTSVLDRGQFSSLSFNLIQFKPLGMQASILGACPKPVMAGRASGIKMVGMAEVGTPISLDRVASGCVIFTLHQKTQKMASKDMIVRYHPCAPPHAYENRWGNPAKMQHNSVLGCRLQGCVKLSMMQGCVNDDLRADGL